ncbi:MAG TPA: hypothetical protein VF230_04905 [Acidimicrobiales bacterium]
MSHPRRRLATPLAALAFALATIPAATGVATASTQGDTTAVAINTRDGASIFRLAFQIRRVADGTIDQGNAAAAIASCVDCQTVALAFQVVLALGDTDTVTPENLAIAINTECSYCLTYAAATQVVIGFDGAVRFTDDGNRRLAELRHRLLALGTDDTLTIEQLNAAVEEARAELADILATELVEVEAPPPPPPAATASTTTAPSGESTPTPAGEPSTTTTAEPASSTTATTDPPASSTTTTTEPAATTTTAP